MTPHSTPKVTPHSPASAQDALGVVCCGALAFVISSIAHEAVGHGGMALFTGAKITRLSSVLFSAAPAGSIVDAGGPLMNFLLAGGAAFLYRRKSSTSGYVHLLVVALIAINLFWGFGYFIYSGITQKGDWGFLFEHAASASIWRVALVVVGVVGYARSATAIRRMLLPFAQERCGEFPARSLFRTSILLYIAAGATCCGATLFYRGPVAPALHESALESFGGFIGLATIAFRKIAETPTRSIIIPPNYLWRASTAVIVIAFTYTLGRGYFG